MIFDASTSLASTRRSAADSFDRSALMLVGANRAVIFCSLAASDTLASWAATPVTATATMTANTCNGRMGIILSIGRSGGWRLEVGG